MKDVKIRFNNDYNRGAHPAILSALSETNGRAFAGYGEDGMCLAAAREIRRHIDRPDAQVHFLTGGTQTNFIVIAAALRPYQSVISPVSGHINVHETGAVENCGHKITALPAADGKIIAEQIEEEARAYRDSDIREHITEPKMVYISFPTEYGTIYSKAELEAIRKVCDEFGLYLFIDGARLGYGMGSGEADVTAADIARFADVFYFGGTKCGALFGEALVITAPELQKDFRSFMKQNGAMLAKGWLLGVQFYELFKGDGLYFEITRRADEMAERLAAAFGKKGIEPYIKSPTNQQFIVLTEEQAEKLSERYIFEFERKLPEGRICVRFCTSWSTDPEELCELISDIEKL